MTPLSTLHRLATAAALALAVLLPGAAGAATAQEELGRFLDGVRTLQAQFEQVQKDERGDVLQRTEGRLWLSRPGRFRWSYEKPYQQLLVCDGTTVWLHDPDLAQVTKRPAQKALAGTPAELLSQGRGLTEMFTVEDAGSEGAARIVRLLPRSEDGDFKSIELWLADGTPQRMRFLDQLGGITEVAFTGVTVNGAVDEKQFQFVPPAGTEVVEAE